MVKAVDDVGFHQGFQIVEVDHHPVTGMTGLQQSFTCDRHLQIVGVPMNIPAHSVIVMKDMRHLKMKPLGNSYSCHIFAKNGIVKLRKNLFSLIYTTFAPNTGLGPGVSFSCLKD
jgi:hypothetical protein